MSLLIFDKRSCTLPQVLRSEQHPRKRFKKYATPIFMKWSQLLFEHHASNRLRYFGLLWPVLARCFMSIFLDALLYENCTHQLSWIKATLLNMRIRMGSTCGGIARANTCTASSWVCNRVRSRSPRLDASTPLELWSIARIPRRYFYSLFRISAPSINDTFSNDFFNEHCLAIYIPIFEIGFFDDICATCSFLINLNEYIMKLSKLSFHLISSRKFIKF